MRPGTKIVSLIIVCALSLGFTGKAHAVKYLWQVALEEIEGANEYIFDLEPKLNKKRLQMIMQAKPSMKYIELTDEEINAFKEKAQPLRQKYLKMGGKGAGEVLGAVLNDIEWAQKN